MRAALGFMVEGESYFRSAFYERTLALLSTYGPEFPEEIKPKEYLAMAHRYRQERLSSSSPR
jgi:hypothetical protein